METERPTGPSETGPGGEPAAPDRPGPDRVVPLAEPWPPERPDPGPERIVRRGLDVPPVGPERRSF